MSYTDDFIADNWPEFDVRAEAAAELVQTIKLTAHENMRNGIDFWIAHNEPEVVESVLFDMSIIVDVLRGHVNS